MSSKSYQLVIVRHGESQWNQENRFTGWVDVDLSDQGRAEALKAGRSLKEHGFQFDVMYTSYLRRAIKTGNVILEELGQLWIPVIKDWRLNERHYGSLQGLNKSETAAKYGEDQVKIWRRSYDTPPPLMPVESAEHPSKDPRYSVIPKGLVPSGESLKDTVARFLPLWNGEIKTDLRAGKTVLIAAHGNSLRALIQNLEGLTPDEIMSVNMPTGVPLRYTLSSDFKVLEKEFIGDPETVKAAMLAVANQGKAK